MFSVVSALVSLKFEEYRQLVEQSPILIWRSNLTLACDYFNDRWLAFTGRTMAQEFGNGWAEGIHPEDFNRCLEIYQSAFAQRVVFQMEYRLKRHDGVYRWILDRGTPFNDPRGGFAGYIGSCIDINDQIEAQEALRQSQQAEMDRLRLLLPICAQCHKVRDDKGYWNQLEAYLGEHAQLKFTHGICPDCVRKLFPEARDVGV